MVEVLTASDMPAVKYNSDESLSDSSSDSVSSSDNEIDDIAVADAIINDDSSDEEKILNQDFSWETGQLHKTQRSVQL